MDVSSKTSNDISFDDFRAQILKDYEIAVVSGPGALFEKWGLSKRLLQGPNLYDGTWAIDPQEFLSWPLRYDRHGKGTHERWQANGRPFLDQ